jgi:two-component system CheB/CheR fusion protein
MDGYELIVALRARSETANVRAIALTGFGRPLDARRALAAGFDAHVSKPVVVDELLQTIHRLPRSSND